MRDESRWLENLSERVLDGGVRDGCVIKVMECDEVGLVKR